MTRSYNVNILTECLNIRIGFGQPIFPLPVDDIGMITYRLDKLCRGSNSPSGITVIAAWEIVLRNKEVNSYQKPSEI